MKRVRRIKIDLVKDYRLKYNEHEFRGQNRIKIWQLRLTKMVALLLAGIQRENFRYQGGDFAKKESR